MHPYDAEKWKKRVEEVIAKGPYQDNWASLMRHETPKWFRDAKFGIFIHWGLFTVPEYDNEWYPRNMYIRGSRANLHQEAAYGPLNQFGYKDFIPMFRAEKFDPGEWAELFRKTGAKYVVPVAEHHDGFQMYRSELSHWNAAEMGPCRDVTGELTDAIRREGMIAGVSSHRIEHWFFLSHGRDFDTDVAKEADDRTSMYWPSQPVPDDRTGWDNQAEPAPSAEFLEDWMFRTVELIDRFQPQELYFDWWIMHEKARPYLKKIAAYYYNRAEEWGKEVLLINKMGAFMYGTAVRDTERGQFDLPQPDPWQTDTAIAKNSWCYTRDNVYKSAASILADLVDAVAKNGCMLLNVGPKADGSFSEEDRRVLEEIGSWMETNGEAIYGSRTFLVPGEGPTPCKKGAFSDAEDTAWTSQDFRFTLANGCLYAIALHPAKDGHYLVKMLRRREGVTQMEFNGIIRNVTQLGGEAGKGTEGKLSWNRNEEGLSIQTAPSEKAAPVVFRIECE